MKNLFLNITNHNLTGDQKLDININNFEPVELPEALKQRWGQMTPDNWKDTYEDVLKFALDLKADELVCLIAGYAPAVYNLTYDLDRRGDTVVFADSKRVSIESTDANGAVTKNSVFKHQGFYNSITGEKWSL